MTDDQLGNVDITCSDAGQLRQWTLQRWLENIDSVLAARQRHSNGLMTKTALKEFITAAGFWTTPNGLLADMELRLVTDFLAIHKYDSMHT